MIYIKKKSWIKKVFNTVKSSELKSQKNNLSFLKFLKGLGCFLVVILAILYVSYLYFLPKLIQEDKIETVLNTFLSKNTKLSLDVENIKIYPNYKFDINLKANKIRLIYPDKSDFIVVQNLNTNINLIKLLLKRLDINKVDIKNLTLNTDFSKSFDCLNYIDSTIFDKQSKIPISYLKINIEEFNFNLYDKNVEKAYKLKANKLKLTKINENILTSFTGNIKQNKKALIDFKGNFSFILRKDALEKLKLKIFNINQNPFLYADKYNFYTNSDINLKYNVHKKSLDGYIKLDDFSFSYMDLTIPKNSFVVDFKGDSIYTNCKFNLINKQFINLELKAKLNKLIEAKVLSNNIDLKDLSTTFKTFLKIANIKYDLDNIDLKGNLKADLYLKSDFKTLISKGNLDIFNAMILMKNPSFKFDNINSNISFLNNKINIVQMSGYIDKEKIHIKGNIDEKTNLNLDINSDEINLSKLSYFVNNLPLLNVFKNDVEKIKIFDGFLTINLKVLGNFKNPIIQSNSKVRNLKAYLKDYKTNLLVKNILISANPKINEIGQIGLNIDETTIQNKNPITIKNIKAKIKDGSILANGETILNNNFVKLKSKNNLFKFNLDLKLENNKAILNKFSLLSNNINLVEANGNILNYKQNPGLNNLKINILNKTGIILTNLNTSFDILGNIILNGTIKNPTIDGTLSITNFINQDYKVSINGFDLNIKNSIFKLNIPQGKILNSNFNLLADCKILNDKILVQDLKLSSDYINLSNFKTINSKNSNSLINLEITDLKGLIGIVDVEDITLENLNFKGNFKNNLLMVDNYQANLYDGLVDGKLSYNLKTSEVKTTTLLKGIGVRHLSNRLKAFSIAASGRLSSMIDTKFYLTDNETNLIKSINGYLKFNIDDGELNHFAKLERFLQAGNILSQSILKLNLNSILSTVTKQNTGHFKTIEGTIKISDSIADIQYIKTQGENMSMYIKGNYNLISSTCIIKVLGRIPLSIVNIMGNVGKTSIEDIVNKISDSDKKANEENVTTNTLGYEIDKIPQLYNQQPDTITRLFSVIINGDVTKTSSIKSFRWIGNVQN